MSAEQQAQDLDSQTAVQEHPGTPIYYTLIAYRENYNDYCRGCLMDSSHSEQEIVYSTDLDEIIEKVLDYEEIDKARTSEYASTECTVLASGREIHAWCEDEDWLSDVYKRYHQGLDRIRAERDLKKAEEAAAAKAAADLYASQAAERKAQADREKLERLRQEELATLARLQAKYGGGSS